MNVQERIEIYEIYEIWVNRNIFNMHSYTSKALEPSKSYQQEQQFSDMVDEDDRKWIEFETAFEN